MTATATEREHPSLPDLVLSWHDGSLRFLDQTLLPGDVRSVETRDYRAVVEAVRSLRLRGAPLLGIAAAYAAALAAREFSALPAAAFRAAMGEACDRIAASRPTAVNLFWALGQARAAVDAHADPRDAAGALEALALALHRDDARRCALIAEHGCALLLEGMTVLTHCNTGALATGGAGTALGILAEAHARGMRIRVVADETRPLLQGARLTMWELGRLGIPARLIADGAAAALMRAGGIDAVIIGADRIAVNGDTANKIGSYAAALAAARHGVPFYVAAPASTIDRSLADGASIPIEERPGGELTSFAGRAVAPAGAEAWNPAFDVTPHELITAIVTEYGIFAPPCAATLSAAGA